MKEETIKKHLLRLRQPYSDQAIKNTLKPKLNETAKSAADALWQAFEFRNTLEGQEYWIKVYNSLLPLSQLLPAELQDLLIDIDIFIDGYVDIIDSELGPAPNEAMKLKTSLQRYL